VARDLQCNGNESMEDSTLHGNAPDDCPAVLLLIDVINDFEFEGAEAIIDDALLAARALSVLKDRCRALRIPTIYANDNFGRWRSDFRAQLRHCQEDDVRGRCIATLLEPQPADYFVLKAKQSAFFETSLGLLLRHLHCSTLILGGFATDRCVLFTALDAHLRGYRLYVPGDVSAAESPRFHEQALEVMRRVADADTRPAADLDLGSLRHAGGPGGRCSTEGGDEPVARGAMPHPTR
jgi:nicotinamidase-related amidase